MATECHYDLSQIGRCAVTYDDVTTSFSFENHKQCTLLVQGERENAFRKIIAPEKASGQFHGNRSGSEYSRKLVSDWSPEYRRNKKMGNKFFGNPANSKCLATSPGGRSCMHEKIRAD